MTRALWLWLALHLLTMAGACNAEGIWSGAWETHWRGGGGQLILRQDGAAAAGEFPLFRGHITATATDRALDGQWATGNQTGGDQTGGDQTGRFNFILGSDGKSFAGRDENGDWWTGERSARFSQPLSRTAVTPRAAFSAFLIAANQARDGDEDAWAAAVAAVDFGPAESQLPPRRQVPLVRQFFDLIDLTTFDVTIVPDLTAARDITQKLPQRGSDAALTLTMRHGGDGVWRLAIPAETDLATARKALLARTQGHAPAADAFQRLRSPRDAMRAFLAGMSYWDAGGSDLALSTLNLRNVPDIVQRREGARAARYLRRALEHIGMTGLQSIPDDGTSREPYVHFVDSVGSIVIAPSGPEADAAWQFTPQTVATIDNVFMATEALPPPVTAPPGQIPRFGFFQIRDFIGTLAPALLGRVRHVEYWQILAYPMLVALMFGLAHGIARAVCSGILLVLQPVRRVPAAFVWSLKILLLFGLLLPMADLLSLPINVLAYTAPFSRALACLLGSVAAWHLLRMIGEYAAARTKRKATYTDDIPITLVMTAAQFAVVIVGTVGVAYFLAIPAANILAGIGIGGLAVAFASRETLANIFGAGILVSDRPFRQGDWIKSGDIEGAIEQVGIWSTRVRTTNDSVIVVPNGKLIESTINNMGQRRHRIVETQLVVTSGATPEKLDAFTEALRRRIAEDPILVTDRTMINVSDFSELGVVIRLIIYLDVADPGAEGRARHALMLDILRLAQQEGLRLGAEWPRSASERAGGMPILPAL